MLIARLILHRDARETDTNPRLMCRLRVKGFMVGMGGLPRGTGVENQMSSTIRLEYNVRKREHGRVARLSQEDAREFSGGPLCRWNISVDHHLADTFRMADPPKGSLVTLSAR